MMTRRLTLLLLIAYNCCIATNLLAEENNARKPKTDVELQRWLTNMIDFHGFSIDEVIAATGLSKQEAKLSFDARKKKRKRSRRPSNPQFGIDKFGEEGIEKVLVLPYPGGRHPRIGFLDGALRPQRETKVSIFAPYGWDDDFVEMGENRGYVVVDVPQAIWFGEGNDRQLLYLAHTHLPTVWTKQNVQLKPLEWSRDEKGNLIVQRCLPNNVYFGARITPTESDVRMELWITNRTKKTLRGLKVQNCVLLKALRGFEQQGNNNKLIIKPFAAAHDKSKSRWVITGWELCDRAWADERCPCMHSDPQFPDCPPGETKLLRGWLSFYCGFDVRREMARIDDIGWLRPE